MTSLQSHSTHWRATCSYPTHGVDFRDYIRGTFKDFNIVTYIGAGQCKKVEFVNIQGHVGMHRTARSGRALEHGACTSIVRILAVSLIRLLARFGAKIILVFTGIPTRSSVAPRMISQQHSGGLEVICEEHDLNHGINIPLDSPKSLIVVAIFVSRKGKLVDNPTAMG